MDIILRRTTTGEFLQAWDLDPVGEGTEKDLDDVHYKDCQTGFLHRHPMCQNHEDGNEERSLT